MILFRANLECSHSSMMHAPWWIEFNQCENASSAHCLAIEYSREAVAQFEKPSDNGNHHQGEDGSAWLSISTANFNSLISLEVSS